MLAARLRFVAATAYPPCLAIRLMFAKELSLWHDQRQLVHWDARVVQGKRRVLPRLLHGLVHLAKVLDRGLRKRLLPERAEIFLIAEICFGLASTSSCKVLLNLMGMIFLAYSSCA